MQPSRKKILVADCDTIVLAVINYLLTRQGYLVKALASAPDADAALRAEPFDAALLCCNLCGDDWLRSLFADVPSLRGRVILTGKPGDDPHPAVCSILEKPIDFTLLVQAVRRCLGEEAD